LNAGAKKLALHCAKIAGAKKGNRIAVLDIRHVSEIADYFVLASGGSQTHVRAMAEEIVAKNESVLGQSAFRVEGLREGNWVVMDYVDVVVHLFTDMARQYYNLEKLWGDAKKIGKS